MTTTPAMPVVRREGDAVVFEWDTEKVSIELDRVTQERGTILAEITIRTSLPGVGGHLHRGRLNLLSTSSRATLARFLEGRTDGLGLDWPAFLEYAAVMAVDLLREGEPVVNLADLEPREEVRHRLHPVAPKGKPTEIFGDGGSGKSTLADLWAISVHMGIEVAGFVPERAPVLILDWEEDADTHRDRQAALCAGLSLEDVPPIFYRQCFGPLDQQADSLCRFIDREGVGLVIIDSVGASFGGEPESAELCIRQFGAIRSLRCTALLIDHVARESKDHKPFGSAYKFNLARSVWEIRRQQRAGENVLHMGLYNRKVNFGPLEQPIGLALHFEKGRITARREDIRAVPELTEGLPLVDRVTLALKDGPRDTTAVAEELDMGSNKIRAVLSRYKGHFVKVGALWALRSGREESE